MRDAKVQLYSAKTSLIFSKHDVVALSWHVQMQKGEIRFYVVWVAGSGMPFPRLSYRGICALPAPESKHKRRIVARIAAILSVAHGWKTKCNAVNSL